MTHPNPTTVTALALAMGVAPCIEISEGKREPHAHAEQIPFAMVRDTLARSNVSGVFTTGTTYLVTTGMIDGSIIDRLE